MGHVSTTAGWQRASSTALPQAPPGPAPPHLHRVYVAADGRLKALFSDNSLLLLSPSGEAFLHVSSSGARTKQLCDFALRRFWPQLSQALAFHNLHQDAPLYPKPLLQTLNPGDLFTVGYPIPDVCWPRSAEEALDHGLVEFQEHGRVAVRSRCCTAQLVLERHRLRFAVCYPLLLSHDAVANTYTYVWHRQAFSSSQYPKRWAPALAAAAAVADSQACDFSLRATYQQSSEQQHSYEQQLRGSCEGGWAGSDTSSWGGSYRGSLGRLSATASSMGRLPWQGAQSAICEHERGAGHSVSDSRAGREGSSISISNSCGKPGAALSGSFGAEGSWWYEATPLLPVDELIVMEWSADATLICAQARDEVEVWLHADDSCMASMGHGRFIQHWVPGEEDPRVYAAEAAPDHVTSMATGQQLHIGVAVARALRLRSAMSSVKVALRPDPPPALTPAHPGAAALTSSPDSDARGGHGPLSDISNTRPAHTDAPGTTVPPAQQRSAEEQVSSIVVEEQWVEGTGHFVAYADGRVKCVFADRTILNTDAARQVCRLVLPDGSRAKVAVANPVGVEQYVAAAVEFAAWGFKTPAERAQALRMQAVIQAELRSSERMALICSWASHSALPPAAAAASGRLPWEAEPAAEPAAVQHPGGLVSGGDAAGVHNSRDMDPGCTTTGALETAGPQHERVCMSKSEREQYVQQQLQRNTELLQRLSTI